MRLYLDSGGVSALAGSRARLAELRDRGLWPAQVPSVVLAEALTGDHRRDHLTNRMLRACQVRAVDELHGRAAGRLRTGTGRAGSIAATDAVVVAMASTDHGGAIVLTGDVADIAALADVSGTGITVMAV